MKPKIIIKDIIWAYTKTGNIPQVQKMYAPVIAAYAMAKYKTMNFDKIKMANQSYNFNVVRINLPIKKAKSIRIILNNYKK